MDEVVESSPRTSTPCAIRWPNPFRLANSASMWIGAKSPVRPAKRLTSLSPIVLENSARSPGLIWMSIISLTFLRCDAEEPQHLVDLAVEHCAPADGGAAALR